MFERLAPEQHDSLPDIPEPSENPHLYGHEEAAGLLAGAYRAGKMHHAVLLTGPQGIGKATLAFRLAHHLLKHPNGEEAPDTLAVPDPASSLFRMIAGGAHPSVLHLTRPFNDKTKAFKTVITVEEIRRVSRFLGMTSHDGSYRVVIVDPADDMNANAANALLKNLEEPPRRTIFILITHSAGGLLPTIRSRCQLVRLQPLSAELVAKAVAATGAGAAAQEAAVLERAEGSVRNAILLTQYGGLEIAEAIDEVLGGVRFDAAKAHKIGDAVAARDRTVQFGIFNRHLLDMIARRASAAAEAGALAAGDRLAELWQETVRAIGETETFNLDRKQHVVGLLGRVHGTLAP